MPAVKEMVLKLHYNAQYGKRECGMADVVICGNMLILNNACMSISGLNGRERDCECRCSLRWAKPAVINGSEISRRSARAGYDRSEVIISGSYVISVVGNVPLTWNRN